MKMHRNLLLIPTATLLLVGCTEEVAVRPPPPRPAVVVENAPPPGAPAPPPLRVEVQGPRPYAAAVWHRGHWRWNGRRYVWVPGHWARV
jgi:hypothetical protein